MLFIDLRLDSALGSVATVPKWRLSRLIVDRFGKAWRPNSELGKPVSLSGIRGANPK